MPRSVRSPKARPPNIRRRRFWLAVLFPLSMLLTACVSMCCVTVRPDWYSPRPTDYGRLDADQGALVNLIDDISGALNRDRSAITVTVSVEQLNRWIAARREIPQFEQVSLDPLRDLFVSLIAPDRVRLGATVDRAGFGSVLSVDVCVRVVDNQVMFEWQRARAGWLPLPQFLIRFFKKDEVAADPGVAEAIRTGAFSVSAAFQWPNGKTPCRITEIEIRDQDLIVRIAPE